MKNQIFWNLFLSFLIENVFFRHIKIYSMETRAAWCVRNSAWCVKCAHPFFTISKNISFGHIVLTFSFYYAVAPFSFINYVQQNEALIKSSIYMCNQFNIMILHSVPIYCSIKKLLQAHFLFSFSLNNCLTYVIHFVWMLGTFSIPNKGMSSKVISTL